MKELWKAMWVTGDSRGAAGRHPTEGGDETHQAWQGKGGGTGGTDCLQMRIRSIRDAEKYFSHWIWRREVYSLKKLRLQTG